MCVGAEVKQEITDVKKILCVIIPLLTYHIYLSVL